MKNNNNSTVWSSKIGFILAAVGSAIGLGNIWKLPYLVSNYGGGTFLVTYIFFGLTIGLSIMIGEFMLGRYLGTPALTQIKDKIKNNAITKISFIYPIVTTAILSFYLVVAGWSFYYLFQTLIGGIEYSSTLPADYYANTFNDFVSNTFAIVAATLVFIVVTLYINYKGVSGIEKANLFMIPALFLILLIMIIRVATLDGAQEGFAVVYSFDPSLITTESIMRALSQAFFSLSIGVAVMIIFSSHVNKNDNLMNSATSTVVLGTGIGIFTCSLIIPMLFYSGGDLGSSGPGLTFITIPNIFASLPLGALFAGFFFLVMFFASVTSAISLVEVTIAGLENLLKTTRVKALVATGVLLSILAVIQALSFNVLSGVKIGELGLFDFTSVAADIALCFGALAVCATIGYAIKPEVLKNEITNEGKLKFGLFNIWLASIRYVIPVVIIIVVINYFLGL